MLVPLDDGVSPLAAHHHAKHPKCKPKIQHHAYQEQAYQMRRETEYQTMHEENQGQRMTVKDQVKIITLQKEEITRLMKMLREKGTDLQFTQDLLDKQTRKMKAEQEARWKAEEEAAAQAAESRRSSKNDVNNGGDQIQALNNKLELAEESLRQKEETIEGMKSDIADARASGQHSHEELSNLKLDLKELDEECERLRRETEDSRGATDRRLKEQQLKFDRAHKEQVALVDELTGEIESLTEENKKLSGKDDRLSEKLKKALKQRDDLEEALEDIRSSMSAKSKTEVEPLTAELASVKKQLKLSLGELEEVESSLVPQLNELKRQIQDFREQKAMQEKVSQARIADAESAKEYAQHRLATLKDEFDKEKRQWEEHNWDQMKRLRQGKTDLQEEMDVKVGELEKKNRELREALKLAMADKVAAEQFDAQSQQRAVRLEAELKRLRDEKEAAEKRAALTDDNFRTLNRNYAALKGKFDELLATGAKATDEVEDLKEENAGLEREADDLEAEIKSLRGQVRIYKDAQGHDPRGIGAQASDLALQDALDDAKQEALVWKRRCDQFDQDSQETIEALKAQQMAALADRDHQLQLRANELKKLRASQTDTDQVRLDEIASLRQKLAAATDTVDEMSQGGSKAMKTALKDLQSTFDTERQALDQKLRQAGVRIADLEAEAADAETKREATQRRIAAMKEEFDGECKQSELQHQEQVKRLRQTNAELQEELSAQTGHFEKKNKELRDTLKAALADKAAAEQVDSGVHLRVTQLQAELKALRAERDAAVARANAAEDSYEMQSRNFATLKASNAKTNDSVLALQEENTDLQNESEMMGGELTSLKQQLAKKEKQLRAAQGSDPAALAEAQNEAQSWKQRCEEMDEDVEATVAALAQQQEEVADRDRKLQLNFAELEKLKADRSDSEQKYLAEIADLKEQVEQMQDSTSQVTALKTSLKEQTARSDRERQALEESLQAANEKLKADRELDSLEAKVESLKTQLRRSKDVQSVGSQASDEAALAALQEAQRQVSELKQRCDDLEKTKEETVAALTAQLAQRDETVDQKEMEIEKLSSTERQHVAEIATLKDKLAAADAKVEEAEKTSPVDVNSIKEAAIKDCTAKFDRERRVLQEKLQLAEASAADMEKSMNIKAKALKTEQDKCKKIAQDGNAKVAAKQRELEQQEKKCKDQLDALRNKLEAEGAKTGQAGEKNRELQRRVTELEVDLEKIKEVQLHW